MGLSPTFNLPAVPVNTSGVFAGAPGSPGWWLQLLTFRLMDRQAVLDIREAYVNGNHPFPSGDRRYVRALRELQKVARTNYVGLATSTPLERMKLRGFRFGPVGEADPDAASIWAANDMELQSILIHQRAATFGLSYAIVDAPREGSKWPTITAETPKTCITYQNPLKPTESLAGLKLWADDEAGRILAVLWLPDQIYGYVGPQISALQGLDYNTIRDLIVGSRGNGLELTGSKPNELGRVPMVQYVWRPGTGDLLPEGQCGRDVRDIQDRINVTMLQRLVIQQSQAYNQKFISGMKIPESKKGEKKPPFDPGADILWVTESTDAKAFQFEAANISPLLEGIRDDIADIAAITKVPPHYLMGKMANVSGETLSQAEAGLNAMTGQRKTAMGWGHVTAMRLAFLFLGKTEQAEDVTSSALWAPSQQLDIAESSDAILKMNQAGIPLQLLMDRFDFSPDEIAFAIKERDRLQQQELQQQQDQAQQAHSQAMELMQQKTTQTSAPGETQ